MNILIKPVVTEKMNEQGEKFNRYGFIVDRKANKISIAKAVAEMYGITVEHVRTMNYLGKTRRRSSKSGAATSGRTNSYKKAIVTLVKGDTIDFYSSI